jgi:hypothetical protein
VPSGHPSYYSFDFGDIHFVSIDSENHVPYNDETFFEWLEKDLEAAQSSAWRVAYFHHPPYSKGSHDSDDEWGLKKMRERLVPLLEEKRVEIVFTGHSHAYERSNLLGGLYEGSWKTDEHTKAEPEKAEPEKAEARSEARSKDKLRSGGKGAARLWQAPPETGWDEHDRLVKTDCGPLGGTLYVVAGSASQTGKGRINHKAMRYSTKSKGSALLSIMGNSKARIDFVNSLGVPTPAPTPMPTVKKNSTLLNRLLGTSRSPWVTTRTATGGSGSTPTTSSRCTRRSMRGCR